MSHSTKNPALTDHLAWLGYVQPDGLVVSAPALVDAQAIIDRAQLGELQRRFAEHVTSLRLTESDTAETQPGIENIQRFVTEFLGWPYELLVGLDPSRPLPESLYISLPEFQETLRPSFAVKNSHAKNGDSPWLMLVQSHPATVDLDRPAAASDRNWHASPAKKFERLLRETAIPIGLLTNGIQFRLIYAPPKENSGSLTFPVGAMAEVSGRLILGAFQLLLSSWTLFNAPTEARLPGLLQRSRDYQASVSEILAEQVLHALYELLRGFEAADERAQGKLLRELAAKNPGEIYGGLVAVLLRFVFTLFAEDRGLLPASGLYVRNYSLHGLFERLRADNERYPDTMDHRFGAWAQLLALFRAIHGGCRHPELKMPARHGHLFDPDRYPFLEGRASYRDPIGPLPLVSDGTVYRILEKLSILEGERISYRALSVEEIGSVYQTIMGFAVEIAGGTAIALKGKRKNGGVPAAPVINLEALLVIPAKDRNKWLKEKAETELSGEAEKQLKSASTVDDLLVALEKRIDRNATPGPVAKGGLVLQPTDERRRSGSHYTPRSFTEPIVRKTLDPILKRFGDQPKPEQILELKICDLAVGSAAFLVESCRQLGDELVKAWRVHGGRPALPPDETEELLAMRTIAQRCLYGVDRNQMATDLAKLSLWLATLAKDHPFTFLDHAIRCGDSLVGLTRRQIETFTWKTEFTTGQLWEQEVRKRTKDALRERQKLLSLGDDYTSPQLKRARLEKADELLDYVRYIGDAAICAFFSPDKDRLREAKRQEFIERLTDTDIRKRPMEEIKALRGGKCPVTPFHWEIEFPEVFDRENPGFDGIVGNPPFLGGTRISTMLGTNYKLWLYEAFDGSGNRMDLVAYFFRRAFMVLAQSGTMGLIATNTIAQGDTRKGGLQFIRKRNGVIYAVRRRTKWPGVAAVTVSVIHIAKGGFSGTAELDGQEVDRITAFLFDQGGDDDPTALSGNRSRSFEGFKPAGQGFLFDDGDPDASPLAELKRLQANSRNLERIFPYIGGEEINDSPDQTPSRWAIDFDNLSLEEANKWPELLEIVRTKVKPYRDTVNREAHRERWWQYGERRPGLRRALIGFRRALVLCQTSKFLGFVFIPTGILYSHKTVVIPTESFGFFAAVQSRPHEGWMLFFGSSLEDRPVYTPSDCFETFPFPAGFETNAALESAGREYYEFRAALMVRNNEGLTKTYNRFHDPDERSPEIQKLRDLHAAMDAAVLTAYGWEDLIPKCECKFILDYEDDEGEESECTGKRKKKKPYRFRWPDEIRDEVLARLLKLNAGRAKEEELAGQTVTAKQPKKAAKKVVVPNGLPLQPRTTRPRKHSQGINFKRGAIASYAVNRLCDRPEFGRIQMEKVFYGVQCIIGIDLEMDFKPYENGPFDEAIHKIESLAKKEQWFYSVPRKGGIGTEYHRGEKILDRCGAAKTYMGEHLAEFDRILDFIAKMDSEQAGIWTTVHFVWNDLLLIGKPASDDEIVKGFYAFHEAKKSIEEWRVRVCIEWLRDQGFVPRGVPLQTAQPKIAEQELALDFSEKAPEPEPVLYAVNLVLGLLSEAGGSLSWARLLDAYVLATNPKLMQRFAPPLLKSNVKAWMLQNRPSLPDGLLLPSLNQLGANNLTVSETAEGLTFHLLDGPRSPATTEIADTSKLSLRIAATLTPDTVPIPQRAKWTKEAKALVLA